MRRWYPLALLALLPITGCANDAADAKKPEAAANANKAAEKSEAEEIKESLAKLSPEDRKLAEEQKYCPDSNELLGTMGPPMKVLVKEKPVFICCKGCKTGILQDPDKTLAKVEELKKKAAAEAQK